MLTLTSEKILSHFPFLDFDSVFPTIVKGKLYVCCSSQTERTFECVGSRKRSLSGVYSGMDGVKFKSTLTPGNTRACTTGGLWYLSNEKSTGINPKVLF